MLKRISLIVGSHDHLPPGAGDAEFEELYRVKLQPFITSLHQHPSVQAVLHFSGALFSWLEQKKPELFLLIRDLASRKQVEFLGGGFYEPLLPLIPLADKIGQIEMLTTYIRQKFGRRPQGCWIPFGAWEQSLVGVLTACGMYYTFLGEDRFRSAGAFGAGLYSPCLTEEQGKLLTVFPLFPLEEEVHGPVAFPLPGASGERRILTVFPRFSLDHPKEAMDAFFEGISKDAGGKKDDFESTLPGKVYRSLRSLRRFYFTGQSARDCLVRFPEANDLYSKMFFTNTLINQLRGDKVRKRAAREELWKAQGAASFLDVRGGITCALVRKHSYRALIGAERITREKGSFKPSLQVFDFNLDGEDEYLFQDKLINCYVKARGASLFELDYFTQPWNYLDTLARRGVEDTEGRRCAFMDWLLPRNFSFDSSVSLASAGGRFCGDENYEPVLVDKQRGRVRFVLSPKKEGPLGNIEIEKCYQLEKNTLVLSYSLSNRGGEEETFCFIPQFDLSFAGDGDQFFGIGKISSGGERVALGAGLGSGVYGGIQILQCTDKKNNAILDLYSDQFYDLYFYPVKSPCNGKPVEAYQSSCFLPLFHIALPGGRTWKNSFKFSISTAKTEKAPKEK